MTSKTSKDKLLCVTCKNRIFPELGIDVRTDGIGQVKCEEMLWCYPTTKCNLYVQGVNDRVDP